MSPAPIRREYEDRIGGRLTTAQPSGGDETTMTMLYTTDSERRALMAERERAARCLDDLMARERTDLAPHPVRTLRRPRIAWRWAGVSRAIQSLATTASRRPRALTEECA